MRKKIIREALFYNGVELINTLNEDDAQTQPQTPERQKKTINLKIQIPARPNSFSKIMMPVRQGKADNMFGIKHFTTNPMREVDSVTDLAKKYFDGMNPVEFMESCLTGMKNSKVNLSTKEVEPNNTASSSKNRVDGKNTDEKEISIFDHDDTAEGIDKYGSINPYQVNREDSEEYDKFVNGEGRKRPDAKDDLEESRIFEAWEEEKETNASKETEKIEALTSYFSEALAKVNELINIQLGSTETNFSESFMDIFGKIQIENEDPSDALESLPRVVNAIRGIFNKMFSNHEKMKFIKLYKERCNELAKQADQCIVGHITAFCEKFPKSPMRKEKLLMLWKRYSLELFKEIDNPFASELINGEGYQYLKTVLLSTVPSLFGAMLITIKFMEAKCKVKIFSLDSFTGKDDSNAQERQRIKWENQKIKLSKSLNTRRDIENALKEQVETKLM